LGPTIGYSTDYCADRRPIRAKAQNFARSPWQVTKACKTANLRNSMVREISAGGVVIRKRDGEWWMVAIEPAEEPAATAKETGGEVSTADQSAGKATATGAKPFRRKTKPVLALPKGLVDSGEKPLETALREVQEETGITADHITKLADIKYIYTRAWGDRQRVFKIVSFYLMHYRSGRINEISPDMRVEVSRALWVRLEDAARRLAYSGEKQMAQRALEYVKTHPGLSPAGEKTTGED